MELSSIFMKYYGGLHDMITYEQMLASQTELAHFNANHDPRNGQFAKGHGGSSSLSPRGKQIAKRAGYWRIQININTWSF